MRSFISRPTRKQSNNKSTTLLKSINMKFTILAQAVLAIPALASAIPEPVDTANRESTAKIHIKSLEY